MPLQENSAAIFSAAGCGSHQQHFASQGGDGGDIPEGALIHADFTTGVYYDGAEAEVEDLFYEDDDDFGNFDPATHIVPDVGLVPAEGARISPLLNNDLAAALLASGFTCVMTWTVQHLQSGNLTLAVVDVPGFAEGVHVLVHNRPSNEASIADYNFNNYVEPLAAQPNATGTSRAAFTVSQSKVAISLNGAAVESINPDDFPAANRININLLSDFAVRTITFYAPVADAELPGLATIE